MDRKWIPIMFQGPGAIPGGSLDSLVGRFLDDGLAGSGYGYIPPSVLNIPEFVIDAALEESYTVQVAHTADETIGYQWDLSWVENVLALVDSTEGARCAATYFAFAADDTNIGPSSDVGANTRYYSITAADKYAAWNVPASADGMDTLKVVYVAVAGGGTFDILVNGGKVDEVSTVGSPTNYRASVKVSLSTALSTGDVVRFQWKAGESSSARLTGIVAYHSSRAVQPDEDWILDTPLSLKTSSSISCAYNIAPSGRALKFIGGTHQSVDMLETNVIESWTKDGSALVLVPGRTKGVIGHSRTAQVDYNDGTPAVNIASIATAYTFGLGRLSVSSSMEANESLDTGDMYPAMTIFDSSTSGFAPKAYLENGTEVVVSPTANVFMPTTNPAIWQGKTPLGQFSLVSIDSATHPIKNHFFRPRTATDNKAYWNIDVPSTIPATTQWGGGWSWRMSGWDGR